MGVTALVGAADGAAGAPADAAANDVVVERIIVTGSRLKADGRAPPPAVSVVDRGEIAVRQPADMPALLMGVPSVFIEHAGSPGALSSAMIRGGDPSFTLVLVDGIEVNDPTNSRGGSFDFSVLDPYGIERVEVLRGAVSAVHGSEAVAGVINVVTRQPEPDRSARVRATVQTDRALDGSAALGGPLGPGAFALASSFRQDGDDTVGDLQVASLQPRFHTRLGDHTGVTASARLSWQEAEFFPEDSGGPRFAERRDLERRSAREQAAALQIESRLAPAWELSANADVYRRTEDVRSPGVAPGLRDPQGLPPSATDTRFVRYRGSGWLAREGDVVSLLGGAEIRRETGTSDGVLEFPGFSQPADFDLARTTRALFAQGRVDADFGLSLTVATRRDFTADDNRTSSRAGLSQRIGPRATLFASWSEGFRLPSFFALGHPLVGNPELAPETSESIDGGIRFAATPQLTVTLAGFHSTFRRLVDFEPGPPPRLVNRSRVTSTGWEAQVEAGFDAWSGRLFVSYVETDVDDTGQPLRDRPKWQGGGYVAWQATDRLTLSSTIMHVGRIRRSAIPTGDVTLGSHVLLDLAGELALNDAMALTVAIRNVTDTDHDTAVGVPGPGVRASAGVQVRY